MPFKKYYYIKLSTLLKYDNTLIQIIIIKIIIINRFRKKLLYSAILHSSDLVTVLYGVCFEKDLIRAVILKQSEYGEINFGVKIILSQC